MKYLVLPFLCLMAISFASTAQNDSLNQTRDYPLLLQDTPAKLMTMQQANQTYLSAYRMFSRAAYSLIENPAVADIMQLGALCFYFMTFAHEEGHRSILTKENIGSVSVPYFNKDGAAYVTGVTDKVLQDLRDHNLPVYIRLHTAGLEADYMLAKRMETIGAFGLDDYQCFKWEYLIRKLSILQYYISGLLKYDIEIEEEQDELERDIVGFDTYGAIRHLFRPNMEFYRYTSYEDLTDEEIKFIKRTGYRSLLNLANPLIIGKERFKLTENISGTAGMGYTMAPFGDFIDEQLWINLFKNIHISLYTRQFQNKSKWFFGFGGGIFHYSPVERIVLNMQGHFWEQPQNMQFKTKKSVTGGAIDLDASYFFLYGNNERAKKGLSIDLGFIYKTDGFMPEVMYLDEHIGFRVGTTIRL